MMAGASVLAVAAAFGPLWMVRTGLGVALAAAFLSCAYAGRELARQRRRHAAQIAATTRAHVAALHSERVHNGLVVDALRERAEQAAAAVEGHRSAVEQLRGELASSRGDRARLLREMVVHERQVRILREALGDREAELTTVRSELEALRIEGQAHSDPSRARPDRGERADVHVMPRRMRSDGGGRSGSATREGEPLGELAAALHSPAEGDVVDLRTLATAVVLPNYEADRRLA